MYKAHKIRWKAYLVTVLLGLAVAAGILISRDIMHVTTALDRFHILCDAFFIPGTLMTCFGIMVLIANTGFFYVFDYSLRLFKDRLTIQKKFRKVYRTYFDYVSVKREQTKDSMGFVLHTGLVYLAISFCFNLAFYSEYL